LKNNIGNDVTLCGRYTIAAVLLVGSIIFNATAQDTVLLIRPNGRNFEHATEGMVEDLENEVVVVEEIIRDNSTEQDLSRSFERYRPSAVVLMDNRSIRLYNQYLKTGGESAAKIPVVAFMAILVENYIADIDNIVGISYEVPIVTSAVILRSLAEKPVRKIGVVHRKVMREFVEANAGHCKRENITVVSRCTECLENKKVMFVKRALKELIKKEKVDVLWIPNDNNLLTPQQLVQAWIPEVKKYGIPVIVGVEVLADPKLDFGTLAVMPDHEALGVQAAQMIMNIKDNGWKIPRKKIDPALSVKKVLSLKNAQKVLNVKDEALISIDKVLQ
jgi:hypothetical protein